MTFLSFAVPSDMDIAISVVERLSFGRPGASTLGPWGLIWQLGDTLGDHGSSRKDKWGPDQICNDFGMILSPNLQAFWVQICYIVCFCSGLFPGHFLQVFWVEILTVRVLFFGGLAGSFSDFCCLGDRLVS